MKIVGNNNFTFLSLLEYIQYLIIHITELKKIRFLFCFMVKFISQQTEFEKYFMSGLNNTTNMIGSVNMRVFYLS
jgi:hypothetical protein